MREIRNFSAPDFVLAGKAIYVGAGPPDPPPLDNQRVLSGLCQMPGKVFPAFPAPDDEILIIFHTHIEILSSQDFENSSGNLHIFDKDLPAREWIWPFRSQARGHLLSLDLGPLSREEQTRHRRDQCHTQTPNTNRGALVGCPA